MNYRKLITAPIAMIMLFIAVPGFAADVNELERRLNIVSDELDRIKNSGGSGGGLASRTSVHGYGEVHWAAAIEDSSSKVDHHRFVIGVHSEITNWIHLNAEIDFEHAGQTIEWEFGYLDFMLSDSLNVRAGTMLVPMGNLNEFHEPNLFYTVERPDFHKYLIPTSWQQTGAGIWGAKGDISYRLYLTNALQSLGDNGRKFDNESFVREGRTDVKGIEVGNLAVAGRVEKKAPGGQAGFSFYYGGSTGGRISEDGAVTMLMADYKTKRGPWDVDLGVFSGTIEGITAAMGITASLSKQEREAVLIDVSMLESTMASMGWVISNYLTAGVDPMRMGNENFTSAPSGTFQTGDGLLNIAANKQEQFEILCKLLKREDLLHYPDFKTRELRKTNREILKTKLESELKNNDAKFWSELLNKAGVPAGEVLAVPDALSLDQIQQREFLETFRDVPGIGSSLQVVKTGMQLNGKTLTVDRPPPRLGEDTVAILKDCGYEEYEIEKLQAEKVI